MWYQRSCRSGQILVVDTLTGKVLDTKDVSNHLKNMRPYREWLRDHAIRLNANPELEEQLVDKGLTGDALKAAQKMFMVTFEERDQLLRQSLRVAGKLWVLWVTIHQWLYCLVKYVM